MKILRVIYRRIALSYRSYAEMEEMLNKYTVSPYKTREHGYMKEWIEAFNHWRNSPNEQLFFWQCVQIVSIWLCVMSWAWLLYVIALRVKQ